MILQRAKEEFAVRVYYWAKSQLEHEIRESFPTLQTFKCGVGWQTYQFMRLLDRPEKLCFGHALLKKHHPHAVRVLGEKQSPEERIQLARYEAFWKIRHFYWCIHCSRQNQQLVEFYLDMLEQGLDETEAVLILGGDGFENKKNLKSKLDEIFRAIPPSFEEQLIIRKSNGETETFASKRKLQRATELAFSDRFGDRCIEGESGKKGDRFSLMKMEFCGWVTSTMFDFGEDETSLECGHLIASPDRHPVICAPLMRLVNYMSFGCGLAGNGCWNYVLPNEIESTCAMAIRFCDEFFEALPALLKGLEYDVVELDDLNPRANQ